MAQDFMSRIKALSNPAPRDYSLRPLTSREQILSVTPRKGGLAAALAPLSDALMGRTSNLGISPLSPMTGDMDTVGGELLQGLGNVGLAGLEGVRRSGEIVGEIPFAFGRALGTESESAYNERINRLTDIFDEQTRMQQGQLGTGFSVAEPRTVVGGPSYEQMDTDEDQDAAIRSQIADAQRITEETGTFGDIREPGVGVPDFVGGVPGTKEEIAQALAAASVEDPADRDEATVDLAKKRAAVSEDPADRDEATVDLGTKKTVKGADTPAKQAATSAIDEVLKTVKPDASPKDYDDYMKEFAELTGLDVSGQPDNSQALMAFGLALMQNKAGKGFNVGQILSEVGAAGEKAMPAMAAARKEAKEARISAAKYALSSKKEDEAKALNKGFYYVVPKGGKGFLSNFDKGELKRFNSYDLNNLDQDPSFNEQYEIIPIDTYEKLAKEVFKTPEYGSKYASSYDKISLFTDAPDDLQIGVQRTDANYKGPDRPERGYFDKGQYETYANRLYRMDQGLDNFAKEIATAYSIVSSGEVKTLGQIGDAISDFSSALGITHPSDASDTAKVKRILNVIASKKAPEILQEAGKTISDADRKRVEAIVGRLGLVEPAENLKMALKDMYDFIVVDGKKDVRDGMATLNLYAGVKSPTARAKMVNGVLVVQ